MTKSNLIMIAGSASSKRKLSFSGLSFLIYKKVSNIVNYSSSALKSRLEQSRLSMP